MGTIYPFAGITRIRFNGFDLSPFLFAAFTAKGTPIGILQAKINIFLMDTKRKTTEDVRIINKKD